MSTYSPPRLRAPTACVACNKKKVRCIFDSDSRVCQHCRRHRWPCLQRERRRRKTRHQAGSELSVQGRHASPVEPGAGQTPDQAIYSTAPEPCKDTPSTNPYTPRTPNGGFMGRAQYFQDAQIPVDQDQQYVGSTMEDPTDEDLQLLQFQRAFDLPPRAIREGLVDTFMKRCAPWMPIVERAWLEDDEHGSPSILLLQSVFLAASRVTTAPAVAAYASSHEFYRRAKALFWSGWEKNPITVVASVCILHWYNPEGPERVSTNTSGFWRYVAVGLAHQIGLHKEPLRQGDRSLRRRLWWSLYARDCLISAGQGRPLAVDLGECDLKPPSIEDFNDSNADAGLFSAYVGICSILGHLTHHCRKNSLTRDTRQSLYNSLYRWTRELPPNLRLFQGAAERHEGGLPAMSCLSPYSFEARQLHIPYFVCLTILTRGPTQTNSPSAATLLASSYVAGIFEDFLARDEIQYLGSIFTFYLLAAGTGLLSSKRHQRIWDKARKDLQTIYVALEELAKRWPSAIGALRALQSIDETQNNMAPAEEQRVGLMDVSEEHRPLFSIFGPNLTWAWEVFMTPPTMGRSANSESDVSRLPRMGSILDSPSAARQFATTALPASGSLEISALPRDVVDGDPFHMQYQGMGDWLLEDQDWSGELPW